MISRLTFEQRHGNGRVDCPPPLHRSMAVNIDGDSDSTGSITGQILGVMHGEAAIPKRWLGELELRDVVGAMAQDFIRMMEPPTRPLEDEERCWGERFPPG